MGYMTVAYDFGTFLYNDVSHYTSEFMMMLLQMKYRHDYYQWLVQEADEYWCLAFEEIERNLHW